MDLIFDFLCYNTGMEKMSQKMDKAKKIDSIINCKDMKK